MTGIRKPTLAVTPLLTGVVLVAAFSLAPGFAPGLTSGLAFAQTSSDSMTDKAEKMGKDAASAVKKGAEKAVHGTENAMHDMKKSMQKMTSKKTDSGDAQVDKLNTMSLDAAKSNKAFTPSMSN